MPAKRAKLAKPAEPRHPDFRDTPSCRYQKPVRSVVLADFQGLLSARPGHDDSTVMPARRCPLVPSDALRSCTREPSPASPDRRAQAHCEQATTADEPRRPRLMGWALPHLGGVEAGAGHRPVGHRDSLTPRSFTRYWTRKSRSGLGGRPPLAREVRDLIRKMSRSNPTWGAPPHPQRARQARDRAEPRHRREIHDPPAQAAFTNLARLPRQSSEGPSLHRLLRRANGHVSRALRVSDPCSRPPLRTALQRDLESQRRVDCSASRSGLPGRIRSTLPPARP